MEDEDDVEAEVEVEVEVEVEGNVDESSLMRVCRSVGRYLFANEVFHSCEF